MALVRQPKTAGFRPKSRYDIFVDQLSKCYYADSNKVLKKNWLRFYEVVDHIA